jgi:hypothetical protein
LYSYLYSCHPGREYDIRTLFKLVASAAYSYSGRNPVFDKV